MKFNVGLTVSATIKNRPSKLDNRTILVTIIMYMFIVLVISHYVTIRPNQYCRYNYFNIKYKLDRVNT